MSRNEELFARAQRMIPGGVNSPVRAFRSVGRHAALLPGAKAPTCWTRMEALHRLRGLVGAR